MAQVDPRIFYNFEILDKVKELAVVGAGVCGGGGYEDSQSTSVPVLVKTKDTTLDLQKVDGCFVLSQMSNLTACRCTRKAIDYLASHSAITAIEASNPAGEMDECADSVPYIGADQIHNLPQHGERVVIAVIDSGFDVTHEVFRDPSDSTKSRILALWDQTDTTAGTKKPPTGANLVNAGGTLHTQQDIEGYIQNGSIPSNLKLDTKGHGTHVASIAAGLRTSQFPGGVAPHAKLILVIPDLQATAAPIKSTSGTGYQASYHQALAFIKDQILSLEQSENRCWPVVVNVSQGVNLGAHDGSSPLEASFDEFSKRGQDAGYVVVKSAGNEVGQRRHAKITMLSDFQDELSWVADVDHAEPQSLELWFTACDELKFRLKAPKDPKPTNWVDKTNRQAHASFQTAGYGYKLDLINYAEENGDSCLKICVTKGNQSLIKRNNTLKDDDKWTLEIQSQRIKSDGVVHAWIEKLRQTPIKFVNHISDDVTVSIPGTSDTVICVGAVDVTSKPPSVTSYSSKGPTRDGRRKPDVSAPGHGINAAKPTMQHNVLGSQVTARSGSSFAAPHVAGAIGLLLSKRAQENEKAISQGNPPVAQLNVRQIIAALTQNTKEFKGQWTPSAGYGPVDVSKLYSAFD